MEIRQNETQGNVLFKDELSECDKTELKEMFYLKTNYLNVTKRNLRKCFI